MFRPAFLVRSFRQLPASCQHLGPALLANGQAVRARWVQSKAGRVKKGKDEIYQLDLKRIFSPGKPLKPPAFDDIDHQLHALHDRPPPAPLRSVDDKHTISVSELVRTRDEVPQHEVDQSIDELRPSAYFLQNSAHIALRRTLEKRYSLTQLRKYYVRKLSSTVPIDPSTAFNQRELVTVSAFQNSRTPLSSKLALIQGSELDLGQDISDVSEMILRHIWNIKKKSYFQELGEIEARLNKWQGQLLLHRQTNGQPNYQHLAEPAIYSNAAAILPYRESARLRVVGNRGDALSIMEKIKTRIIDIDAQSTTIQFQSGNVPSSDTIRRVSEETGVFLHRIRDCAFRVYAIDKSVIRTVQHALATVAWQSVIPSSTSALTAEVSTGELRRYTTASGWVNLAPFLELQAGQEGKEVKHVTLHRKADLKTDTHQLRPVWSPHASLGLVSNLHAELRKAITSTGGPMQSSATREVHRWSADLCLLSCDAKEAQSDPSLAATYRLPNLQQLFSYFQTRHGRARQTRELTMHYMAKDLMQDRDKLLPPYRLLNAKWHLTQGETLETKFAAFAIPRSEQHIQLALPACAADLALIRSTESVADLSSLHWLHDVSFVDRKNSDEALNSEFDMVDKEGEALNLDEITADIPNGGTSAFGSIQATRLIYERQLLEEVQVADLVPCKSLDTAESRVANLLRMWPDHITLQLRQREGQARVLKLVDTRTAETISDSMTDPLHDIVEAGLIVLQMLTWAGEGRLPLHTHKQMAPSTEPIDE